MPNKEMTRSEFVAAPSKKSVLNKLRNSIAFFGTLSLLLMFTLTACEGMPPVTPYAAFAGEGELLSTPVVVLSDVLCVACDQATLAAALTAQKSSFDNQAAATAEILRANAQATVNSANATLSAALTQEQSNADYVAAQIAATAEVARANAQATVNSASATQISAMTQSQYDLQVTMAVGTQTAESIMTEQNKNELAANTQTAIANTIATQTQIAVATSQWYVDQTRQRAEQRQGPLAFLWMWCLPLFIILFAVLTLWGFWRWLRIQQSNQRILESPMNRLPALTDGVPHHHHDHDESLPYLESDIIDGSQLTKPDDQVEQWLDEVKDQLQRSEEKDKNDNTDK